MGKSYAIYHKVPLNIIQVDYSNPRPHNDALIEKIELSIRKFGLCIPLVAFKNGILLGGHQRLKALTKLGCKECYINYSSLKYSKKFITPINNLLNKVIQEIDSSKISNTNLDNLELDNLEDVPEPNLFLKNVRFADESLYDKFIIDNINEELCINNKVLINFKIYLPVFVNSDYKVIVGASRARAYIDKGIKFPYIMIDNNKENIFIKSIQRITNTFDFNKEQLRVSGMRKIVGNRINDANIIDFVTGNKISKIKSNIIKKEFLCKFFANTEILDFGSGNNKQLSIIRKLGFQYNYFEPFVPYTRSQVSIKQSLESYKRFLAKLKENIVFGFVFNNAVLNSVGVYEDIFKVGYLLKILAIGGVLAGCARGTFKNQKVEVRTSQNSIVGIYTNKQQFFYDRTFLLEIFETPHLRSVLNSNKYIYYTIDFKNTIMDVDIKRLNEAIDLEFNFRYTDRNLDFASEAKDIFKARVKHFETLGLCRIINE